MTGMCDAAVDMEQFNNCLKLTTTQTLLRYVSECDPLNKRSKGGYLEGRVDVPFQGQQLVMTIDIVPSTDLVDTIIKAFPKEKFPHLSSEAVRALGMTHPNLIHHFRFAAYNKSRDYHKEPAIFNHSWKLEYIIDKYKNIRIRNKKCILDVNRPEVPTDIEKDEAIVGTLDNDQKGFLEGKRAQFVFLLQVLFPFPSF